MQDLVRHAAKQQGAQVGAAAPFIVWKCRDALDGRIAAADGSSQWITSAEARADAHFAGPVSITTDPGPVVHESGGPGGTRVARRS